MKALLQIRPFLENWLQIWPHTLTDWQQIVVTDKGEKLGEKEIWRLSWEKARLQGIKPEEEATMWGYCSCSHTSEELSQDISFCKWVVLSICYVPGTMPGARDTESENQTWLWFSEVSWLVEETCLLFQKAELRQVEGQGTIQQRPSGQRAPACRAENRQTVPDSPGLSKMGWRGVTTFQGVAQGTTRPIPIFQGWRLSGANIINQIQDLFRITLHSI